MRAQQTLLFVESLNVHMQQKAAQQVRLLQRLSQFMLETAQTLV